LVTAARTQLDEAREYGPLRLLSAAQLLADAMVKHASPATRALLAGPLQAVPALATIREDREQAAAMLDTLCGAVARHPVSRFAPERGRATSKASPAKERRR